MLTAGAFFYKVFFQSLLPVPSDTLVGLYHPYRDAYESEYPRGVPFKNFLITDPVRQQIPWRKLSIEAWKNHTIPSWDATSFSGTTLVGNIQAGNFYPLNIFFFLFSFPVAWTILIMSQPVLSVLFLYAFLRTKHLSRIASSIGAITFAFAGPSVAWLTWGTIGSTFLWVPLMLLATDKIHSAKVKWIWRVLFLFSAISSFFAGHIQIFMYGLALVLWYSVFVNKGKKQWVSPWHIISFFLLALITSPQWLPILEFIPQTARVTGGAKWMAEGFFIPVRHLIQFIIPDFFGNPATLNYWGTWNYGEMVGYIGIVGIVLAFLGISKKTLVWIIPIVCSLLFSVQSPVSVLPFRLSIPVLSVFQPTRLLIVVTFCLSILAAFGVDAMAKVTWKKFLTFTSIMALIIVSAWVSVSVPEFFHTTLENALVSKRNLLLPTGLTIMTIFLLAGIKAKGKIRIVSQILWVILLALTIFDLFRFGWKFTPFTGISYFFPETEITTLLKQQDKPFRVMVVDDRALPPNTLSYYGIESVSGYDPIHSERYEEFIASMERGNGNITPPFGFERIMTPKNYNSPLFSLLNVKYVVSIDSIQDPRFELLHEEGQTKLYKNTNVDKRVYLASSVIEGKNKQKIIDALHSPDYEPGKSAIVETNLPVSDIPLGESEMVEILSYASDSIRIITKTLDNRLLVIGNMFDSGWEATVDGKKTIMYRTNYLFQGIIVPTGEHRVRVSYSPFHL